MKLVWNESLKSIIIIILMLIISSIIINIFYYFDVINISLLKYFKMFFVILSFFIGGIYMGKHSPNKGYIYGLRLSLIIILIFILFGIIFNKLNFKRIIFYLITTICITFGSMIGINKKKY